jgi:hypothetical protein
MFFKRKSDTRPDPVAEFRAALNSALDVPGISRHRQAEMLEQEAQAIRIAIACSEACPSAAASGMYDVERLKIKDPPKPAPAPHLAPLRYPQSNDAADVAAYWEAMEARQRR